MSYLQIIDNIREKTNEIILFHSATGKDSIMLLDILSKKFEKVHCVFMYIVKGLFYENKYIQYAEKKYSNVIFYQTPHYCLNSFVKNGYLGIKKDSKIQKNTVSKIDDKFRLILGVNYSVYGFKKTDGITRRFMLNDTDNGINAKTNKCYPLMNLKNKDVLRYINENNLIQPFNYGTLKPSSGCDISTPEFLYYLKNKYPDDLKKIINIFPHCEFKLFNYEQNKE
jgi:sulfate adenylyltransferase subunit 2